MPPAVVLAGGLGTRLRSVVADKPKALAPVAGRPFLAHLLRQLGAAGVRDVVLATGYGADQVEAFVKDSTPEDLRVRCVAEEEPLGTGGALAFATRSAGVDGPFLALNGDTFFGGSLGALVDGHRQAGAAATLALAHVARADRYGRVRTDEAASGPARVVGFDEKGEATGPAWINAGVYVLAPAALADVPPGQAVSLEREVFPRLVARGDLASVRFPDAPFLDIGTPDDYARAADVLAQI